MVYVRLMVELGVACLEAILVSEEFRRKAVASELLKKAEMKAKQVGAHVINLQTGKYWKSRKFYEHHGYKVLCELNNYYGGEDFVSMEKGA